MMAVRNCFTKAVQRYLGRYVFNKIDNSTDENLIPGTMGMQKEGQEYD